MLGKVVLAVAFSACALLCISKSVRAEEPWLAEMPSVTTVIANTQGPDAFDTAARQWVAFDNLFGTIGALIGDRYVQGKMTAAERELRDAYNSNRDRVLMDLKASLPEAERDFYVGTRFAEWSALRDHYLSDPAFNNTLLASLFSADFRKTNSKVLDDHWLFAGGLGLTPGLRPSVSRDLASTATNLLSEWGLVILLVIGSSIGGFAATAGLRSRMELEPKNVFVAHKGNTAYRLPHSTGVVESSNKMGTTNVFGTTSSVYTDGAGNVRSTPGSIGSSTTIHDQFFLRKSDRRLEPVQLTDWDVPVADGHVVSVVWSVPDGGTSRATAVVNHSTDPPTRYSRFDSAFPVGDHVISDTSYVYLAVGCIAVVFGVVTVTASQAANGFLLYPALVPALIVTFIAALFGRSQGKHLAWLRAFGRFRRRDVPRLYEALDREAGQLSQA
jgi:hypothetical protein